jgi:hypothetical protein
LHRRFVPRQISEWCDALPVVGEVYKIRGLQLGGNEITGEHALGLLLEGIANPRHANGSESGFFHRRFVPLSDAEAESAAEQHELQAANEPTSTPHFAPRFLRAGAVAGIGLATFSSRLSRADVPGSRDQIIVECAVCL